MHRQRSSLCLHRLSRQRCACWNSVWHASPSAYGASNSNIVSRLRSLRTALQAEKSVRVWTTSNGLERSRPTGVLRNNGKPYRGLRCIDRGLLRTYRGPHYWCGSVRFFTITYDKRSTYIGFIRGSIYFLDGSLLHLRE